ncbi:MAG: hypothetical protein OXU21_12035 [Chloroflexota bacterium]|nr:hypothetical protein [Chloroflexota bacterium]
MREVADRESVPMTAAVGSSPAAAARYAGGLLLLAALSLAVAVIGRVSAAADHDTLAESLAAIAERPGLYGLGGGGRVLAGVALVAGAWFLLRTWIIRQRLGTPLVPLLLAVAGTGLAVSGVGAIALAVAAPGIAGAAAETLDGVHWIAGKIGFAAAGLALLTAARYQWKVGGQLRRIAPASAVIGLAMQFIWIDAATIMHPIVGTGFFVWLLAVGTMLATGRVERHFTAMVTASATRGRSHVG